MLAGDHLIMHAKQFSGTEYESTILLRNIDPLHSIVRRRNSGSISYGVLALFVFIVLVILAPFTGSKQHLSQALMTAPMLIAGGFTLLFVLLGLLSIRRVEFYQFRYVGGSFDISRHGPDRHRFDAFIARLIARVNELRNPPVPNQAKPEAALPKDAVSE